MPGALKNDIWEVRNSQIAEALVAIFVVFAGALLLSDFYGFIDFHDNIDSGLFDIGETGQNLFVGGIGWLFVLGGMISLVMSGKVVFTFDEKEKNLTYLKANRFNADERVYPFSQIKKLEYVRKSLSDDYPDRVGYTLNIWMADGECLAVPTIGNEKINDVTKKLERILSLKRVETASGEASGRYDHLLNQTSVTYLLGVWVFM